MVKFKFHVVFLKIHTEMLIMIRSDIQDLLHNYLGGREADGDRNGQVWAGFGDVGDGHMGLHQTMLSPVYVWNFLY